jgi:DNA topoisomerase-2
MHLESGSVVVDELPVGMWTNKFKENVEDLIESKRLKSYKNYSSPSVVKFVLEPVEDVAVDADLLKMKTTLSTNNMVFFDGNDVLRKFSTVDEILFYFAEHRLRFYEKRREHILADLEERLKILRNRERFLRAVIVKELVIQERDETELETELHTLHYYRKPDGDDNGFKYLLNQSIRSFSKQKLESLNEEVAKMAENVEIVRRTDPREMWVRELDELGAAYVDWCSEMEKQESEIPLPTKKGKAAKK